MSIFDLFKKKSTVEPSQAPVAGSIRTAKSAHQATPEVIEASEVKESPKIETALSGAKETKCEGKRRVHNLLILDESGSMSSIYQPALTGVNETLQTIREAQKEHPDQEHFVTLVAFDSSHYNQIYKNTPAEKAKDITKEQYRPGGCTPLFDAMGRSITELRDYVGMNDVVLVTIITDGYENASHEYDGRAIKALVESMKSEGWVFTYIGANQDVEAVANAMSIDNHLRFEASQTGARDMFDKEIRCRKKFFSKITPNQKMSDVCFDYFEEDEEEDNQ